MKKLSKFDPQFITDTFFPQFKGRPNEINYGQCFQWAYLARQLYSGIELWDLKYHAFVKYKGKFYDSETPNGIKDWRKLPIIKLYDTQSGAQKSNELKFKINWGNARKNFGLKWLVMQKQAREIIRQQSK